MFARRRDSLEGDVSWGDEESREAYLCGVCICRESKSKKKNEPMLGPHNRHTHKLHHVDEEPYGDKCSYCHIPAIPEFQLVSASILAVEVI